MNIKNYEEANKIIVDVMREIGSIGTGNAATALSSLLGEKVQITVPEIEIKGFNDAITFLGGPEEVVAAVLVYMSEDIEGTILFLLRLEFINAILERILGKTIHDYNELQDMEISVLTEVGNIMISAYSTAVSTLTGTNIGLTVPAIAINMLGGILSVPMAEMGLHTDRLMLINGTLILNNENYDSTILMLPDLKSLNKLMDRLVKGHE